MEQRLSLVTLAVSDVSRSRRFYVEGLGWTPELEAAGVLMIRVADKVILSLWSRQEFEEEVGKVADAGGVPPLTLAHNVATQHEVDQVLREAETAGATTVVPGRIREWGGYSGYFSDPDGYFWEVAMNPGPMGQTLLPGN